jgi:peptidoglycan/LPS O-acetylase OafA/YrhL
LIAIISIILISQPLLRYLLPEYAYTNPLTRLDGLLAGALIAILWPNIAPFFISGRRSIPLLFLSIGYLLAHTYFPELRHTSEFTFFQLCDFTLISLCFGVIVASAVGQGIRLLTSVLSAPVLRSFGIYSYAIYLFHSVVAYLPAKAGLIPRTDMPVLNEVAALTWASAVAMIAWALARFSWRFFEAPLLQYKNVVPYEADKAQIELKTA